jgi:hypothetical protein
VGTADTLIDPPIPAVSAEFICCPSAPDQLLLHLVVPKSPNIHYTSDKACYIRKGAQNLSLKGKAIERLVFSKGQRSYEDVPVDVVRAKELARSDYMQQYLRLVPTAQPATLFLKKQRLTLEDEQVHFEGASVLTAAVLLFDDTPQAALPTKCSIKVTRLVSRTVNHDNIAMYTSREEAAWPTTLAPSRSTGTHGSSSSVFSVPPPQLPVCAGVREPFFSWHRKSPAPRLLA